MLRRLRITAFIFFAALTVALCVFWAISYKWLVGVNRTGASNDHVSFFSMNGAVRLNGVTVPIVLDRLIPGWSVNFAPAEKELFPRERWEFRSRPRIFCSAAPHWFLILVSAMLAALARVPLEQCRPPLQFRVRTMFIATTLVAAVLGLVVWASH